MADNTFRLRVITPQEVVVDENVNMIVMRSVQGEMGVLPGHADYSVLLEYGQLRIFTISEERYMAVSGGVAEVTAESVTIVTKEALWPHDINLDDVQAQRSSIMSRLESGAPDLDVQKERLKLGRVQVMLDTVAEAMDSVQQDR